MKSPFYYWISVLFYTIIIFFSNFGETQLTSLNPFGFGFWFVVLFFAGCLGFLVSYFFGFKNSLWILALVFLSLSFLTAILILIKPKIFAFNEVTLPNIVTQILKLGLGSIFGLLGVLIWQSLFLSKELLRLSEKLKLYENNILDTKREAELLKKEAEVKANEMILDAKKKVQELEKLKRDLEIKLREFLQIELSVLDKHEETLKD